MRARVAVAVLLLTLPVALDAQRLPRIGRPRPTEPTPLPPQTPEIARQLSYRRLPFSFESYTVASFVRATGFIAEGVPSSWSSFGIGTRADYRLMRYVSATLDMTSSMFGGPTRMESIELGTRLRPDRNEHRIYPFIDVRYGYVQSSHNSMDELSGFAVSPGFPGGAQYSRGFGAMAGGGTEIAFSRSWSVTTAVMVMQQRMNAFGYQGTTPTDDSYNMRTVRFAAGVRFNPVQLITR